MAANKSALIAMSGGVDSSIAAKLMLDNGFRCEGTTMRLYKNESVNLSCYHTCCSQQDIEDAAEVAFQLDMPYEVSDFTDDFRNLIIDKFVRVYESGGTPNPCIDCNTYMKFDRLLQYAAQKELYYIVTGHYARIVHDPFSDRYLIKKALDLTKDQSYVLYAMTQEQLSHTLMPLGEWKKDDVRKLALSLGFVNARKHDSQDLCFVPDGDYAAFMEHYTGQTYPQGNFISIDGNIIGRHKGCVRYTIGQRKGLGLPMGAPVYVCGKDMSRNTVTIGPEAALYTRRLTAEDMNYISVESLDLPLRLKARTRYHQAEQWATIYPKNKDLISVEFDKPQRAVTPGQAIVFYDGDTVVGGGTIKEVEDAL